MSLAGLGLGIGLNKTARVCVFSAIGRRWQGAKGSRETARATKRVGAFRARIQGLNISQQWNGATLARALREKAPNALNGNGRRAKLAPRKNRRALPRHLEREPPGHRPAVFVDRLDDHPIGPGLKVAGEAGGPDMRRNFGLDPGFLGRLVTRE